MSQDIVMWTEENGDVCAVGSSERGREEIGRDLLILSDVAEFLSGIEIKLVIAMLDGKNLMFLEQSNLH